MNLKEARMKAYRHLVVAAAALALAACDTRDRDASADFDATAGQPTAEQQPPMQQPFDRDRAPMRIEVDLSARELYVYRNGQRSETHGVAVGSEEWPTRTGEWTIDEVIFNPRWVPPAEEWAEDEDEEEPGADTNPLGRAQLVYDRPRSIHGTNEPGSIGQAVSHGSIRVTNEVAVQLARAAMQAGGVENAEERVREGEQNRNREVQVRLPNPIPIVVRDGGGPGMQGRPGS
jgi:lipoprotein-anchoring transpeptidase ErfK/SrfK